MNSTLTRRQALTLLSGAAVLSGTSLRGASQGADLPKAGGSRLRHSLCRWCYKDIPLDVLAREAAALGYESIELLDPAEWPIVRAAGLTCAVANGTTQINVGLNRLEHHARFVPSMCERIEQAAAAGLERVICFSGNREGLADEQGLENCATGLKQIVSTAERHRVTVVMELLNSRVNHRDYQCDHTAWGVELVKRVGSERFKLLYDIYHMQIMEGDIIATLREAHPYIAHYHTGGVPGRHEINGTQELNYPAIMNAIAETGYRGFVAQEFVPVGEPFAALREARRLCEV